MSPRIPSAHDRGPLSWSLVAAGLWIRTGIAGAGVAIVAPALFATGEASLAVAALLMAAGAALAWLAWHRTHVLLGDDEAVPSARGTSTVIIRRRSPAL